MAADCGNPNCAGCYEVSPGVRIHPPKSSEEFLARRAYWDQKAKERTEEEEAIKKAHKLARKKKIKPPSEEELENWIFSENKKLDD